MITKQVEDRTPVDAAEVIDPKFLVSVALPILQGLLASGDYTYSDEEGNPELKTWAAGDDWKEFGFPKRVMTNAVEDAVSVALELIQTANNHHA